MLLQKHVTGSRRVDPHRTASFRLGMIEELDLFIDIIEFLLLIPLPRGQSQCSSHDIVLFDF